MDASSLDPVVGPSHPEEVAEEELTDFDIPMRERDTIYFWDSR